MPRPPKKAEVGKRNEMLKRYPIHLERVPNDPKEYYCASPDISIASLAVIYQGRKACSKQNLLMRSSQEGWQEARKKYQADLKEAEETKAFTKVTQQAALTLTQINAKHRERLAILYDMNMVLIETQTRVIKGKDGLKKKFTMKPADFRRLVQNEVELMQMERLCNNLPTRDPYIEADGAAENPVIGALGVTAQLDWESYNENKKNT